MGPTARKSVSAVLAIGILASLSSCAPYWWQIDPPDYFVSNGEYPEAVQRCVEQSVHYSNERGPGINWVSDEIEIVPRGEDEILVTGVTRNQGYPDNQWSCVTSINPGSTHTEMIDESYSG